MLKFDKVKMFIEMSRFVLCNLTMKLKSFLNQNL